MDEDKLYKEILSAFGESTMVAIDRLFSGGGGVAPLSVGLEISDANGPVDAPPIPIGVIVFVGGKAMEHFGQIEDKIIKNADSPERGVRRYSFDEARHDG